MADPGAADAAEGATAANKDLWTRINAEYTDEQALRSWAAEDISWGVFNVPEAELDVLGDVADLDVVDLGCGTAYLSAWLARRGARPVGVDLTAAQLDTARRCQARFGISFPLIEADAAQVPLPGASFRPGCLGVRRAWCAPDRWVPEAARLLRPGGRLVFHTTPILVTMCLPEGPGYAGRELLYPQRDVARMRTPDGGVRPPAATANGSPSCAGPASRSTRCTSCTPRRTPRTTRTTISRPRTGHGSGRSKRYGWLTSRA